jgi:aspartate-semialdehyde dehydrogenase
LADSVVVLIGSDTLLGREVREIAQETGTKFSLRLISAVEAHCGTLTRLGDEPALISGFNDTSMDGACAVILAGPPELNAKAIEMAEDEGLPVIDMTGAIEEESEARLRAPLAEDEQATPTDGLLHAVAHPAAVALALFLRRLSSLEAIEKCVVQLFAPAGEHGEAGIEELQQQAVSLLALQKMPQAVFGAQLSFTLLARYGAGVPTSLESIEHRIEHHLATLLALPGEGEGAPMPSLRLIQAPIFHGYCASVWVEFESSPDCDAVEAGLASDLIEVRSAEFEPPNNVGHAGQSGIAVGAIAPDRNNGRAMWFWLVADNLRLSAENAVLVARQLA